MTVSRQKYFTIIHNPTAGRRRRSNLARVIAGLERAGGVVDVLTTKAPGHGSELAASVVGKTDVIVAAGGDGTLAEVVAALVGTDQKAGLIPLGTANVAALDMGLATIMGPRWGRVTRTLLYGAPRPLCLGEVHNTFQSRVFIMMVGVGFDGQAVHGIDSGFKKRWGKLAYVLSGIDAWRRFNAPKLFIETATGEKTTCGWAIVTNGRHYAGPYVLSYDADIFSPVLKSYAIINKNRRDIVHNLLRLGLGRLGQGDDVKLLEGQSFKVTSHSDVEVPVQVDGDAFGVTPIDVNLLQDKVYFMTLGHS